jgi:hypothetical protein
MEIEQEYKKLRALFEGVEEKQLQLVDGSNMGNSEAPE